LSYTGKFRFKRTTPFQEQCGFVAEVMPGEYERCEEESDYGLYFGRGDTIRAVSLCLFHTISQESIWISKGEENES
jgi:hypothetical protein